MISKRLIVLILAFICIGWMYFKASQMTQAYAQQPQNKREPLHLPTTFDDSFQIDREILKNIQDYTVLDNDQRRWDRGFWPCLQAVITLSPEEINRRSQIIDFSDIDDTTDLDQQYRDTLRGTFIRIEGTYQPDNIKYIQLPENPTGRQFMRLGIVGKPKDDMFRINVPEAWLVYFLDDSNANKNDIVQVEGVFFKVMKFVSKKNSKTYYLPVLIARSPTVVSSAKISEQSPPLITSQVVTIVGIISFVLGSAILGFLGWRQFKKAQFKNEVVKKIKDKHRK